MNQQLLDIIGGHPVVNISFNELLEIDGLINVIKSENNRLYSEIRSLDQASLESQALFAANRFFSDVFKELNDRHNTNRCPTLLDDPNFFTGRIRRYFFNKGDDEMTIQPRIKEGVKEMADWFEMIAKEIALKDKNQTHG